MRTARRLLAIVSFVALPLAADEIPLCFSATQLQPGHYLELNLAASALVTRVR